MDDRGANAPSAGAKRGARVEWEPPPLVVALLFATDDGRDPAWRTFLGAYGSTIGSTVRCVVARSAIAGDDTRLLDAGRWVLRRLRARDCHALRMYDGSVSFTAWLVQVVVHLTRAFLSTAGRPRDDDPPDEDGGVAALVPRPAPPPSTGRSPWPNDMETA